MNDALDQLIAGEVPYVLAGCDTLPDEPVFLAGSFNPLHRGHLELLRAAEKISGRRGMFELSITNVDKPPLDRIEIERRLSALKNICGVVLTRAPTFAEKAELFPGVWFALGFDTAIRLLSPRYHADISAMFERFRVLNIRFVAAGRLHEGKFQGLESLEIPAGFDELFIPIPEQIFREDISSTELRCRPDE